jgi:hypothetical protein
MKTLLAAMSLSVLSFLPIPIAMADDSPQWPPAQYMELQESQVHLITNKVWVHQTEESPYTEETWIFLPFDSRLNDSPWISGFEGRYGLLLITGGDWHSNDQSLNFWNLNPDGTIHITHYDTGIELSVIAVTDSIGNNALVVQTFLGSVTRDLTFQEELNPAYFQIDGEDN